MCVLFEQIKKTEQLIMDNRLLKYAKLVKVATQLTQLTEVVKLIQNMFQEVTLCV